MSDPSYSTGTELLDLAQLEPFVEIGFDEFRDILDSMLEEAPVQLDALVASILSNNAAAGRSQAHSLRGMLLNFGCTAIADSLASVERSIDFPGGEPSSVVSGLQTLWTATRSELQDWAASQSGSA